MGVKAIAVFLLLAAVVFAQSQTSVQQNLQTCLSGRYPSLCNHSSLNAEQLKQAQAAEIRENLKTCMTGQVVSRCTKKARPAKFVTQITVCGDWKHQCPKPLRS
jgi:hypothetical protein